MFSAILKKLTEPAASLSESERRRVRLLAWLLLSLLLLTSAIFCLLLISNPQSTSSRNDYNLLIFALILLLAAAYLLNYTGRYTASARLTIICALLGTWSSPIIDPAILAGDVVPLAYVTVSVLLSGMLLSSLTTIILAAIQFTALCLLAIFGSTSPAINWTSFLAYVFATSALSILFNIVSRNDIRQIDQQMRQLTESQALLREQSVRDPLTKLFNRRYLEETLEREINRAKRDHIPLGVIMLDVDHFKRFNDTYGHTAGDVLLQMIGELLATRIRESDIACRYGGEEFTLILPGATLDVLQQRAERLRKEIKTLTVQFAGQTLNTVTLSLGIAVYPDHGATGAMILTAADTALYRAKHAGRDRVAVALETDENTDVHLNSR